MEPLYAANLWIFVSQIQSLKVICNWYITDLIVTRLYQRYPKTERNMENKNLNENITLNIQIIFKQIKLFLKINYALLYLKYYSA